MHIKLKSNGLNIGKDLNNKIEENERLYPLFSTVLKDHIGNCLEHTKMLPIFVNLGFKNSQFISDCNSKKMSPRQMKDLKGVYDAGAVDCFIGNFFAMKADNNRMNKYGDIYKNLAKLDTKLLKTLIDFWEDWLSFDYNDQNDNYNDIIQYFIEDLNNWIENKTVIQKT